MTRLVLAIVAAMALSGCQHGGQQAIDPFWGRTTVPAPATGSIGAPIISPGCQQPLHAASDHHAGNTNTAVQRGTSACLAAESAAGADVASARWNRYRLRQSLPHRGRLATACPTAMGHRL